MYITGDSEVYMLLFRELDFIGLECALECALEYTSKLELTKWLPLVIQTKRKKQLDYA